MCGLVGSVAKNEAGMIVKSPRGLSILLLFVVLAAVSYAWYLFSELQSQSNTGLHGPVIMESGVIPALILGLPLMGVAMGFDLVAGGLELNQFSLLLSYPLSRLQLFVGMLMGRFIVVVTPMYVSSALLLLLFAGPLSANLIGDFVVTMLVLSVGALFWLGLCAAISAFARKTLPSLVYCFTAVFVLAYQSIDLIPNAIVSLLVGSLVVPDQGWPDSPVYAMQVCVTQLLPGNQLWATHSLFAARSVSGWLSMPANDLGIGFPVYVLMLYLGISTTLLVASAAYHFMKVAM